MVREQLNDFLSEIFNSILKLEAKAVNELGSDSLSISELHLIEKIGRNNELRMSDLAKALDITLGTLTVSVDRLEKKGCISRRRIENDRRVVLIKLTPKGAAAYRLHEIFHTRMVEAIVEGLTPLEEKTLTKSLGNLASYFRSLEKQQK